MTRNFDVLVIGSGIAGLSFALKVARLGHSVAIITKKNRAESNTNYAQGGIAVVTSRTDDFDSHVRDTLAAGDGLCNQKVVREIVRDGPARVKELVDIGLKFSRTGSGAYDLGREGGHSRRRILHVKDMTGKAIEDALLRAIAQEPRVALFEHFFAIDVITTDKLAGRKRPRGEAKRVVALHGRRRPGLPLYDQSGHRDGRRHRDGIPGGRRGAEHGVHPVSSDRAVLAARGTLPHQRGGARRGRRAAQRRGRSLHARVS
jgi:L-aspartate oxidase